MSEEKHIFISYRHEQKNSDTREGAVDEALAHRLYRDLRGEGINVWMDYYDIRVGQDWIKALQDGLNNSAALLPILTPAYLKSDYCLREMHRTSTLNNPIYPIGLRRIEAKDRPLEIERIQYVNFHEITETDFQDSQPTSKKYDEKLYELIGALKSGLPAQFGDAPTVLMSYAMRVMRDMESYHGVLEYVDLAEHATSVSTDQSYRPDPRGKRLAPGLDVIQQAMQGNAAETHFNDMNDALTRYQRLAVVGEPGAGKSTLLRRIAFEQANLYYHDGESANAPLPFYVRLSEWQGQSNPVDFIRAQWLDNQLPAGIDVLEFFQSGQGILYLDGLDEMGSQGRQKARQLHDWLHSSNAPQHVVVTARREDYESDLNLGLPTVAIAPMQEPQIRMFVNNYIPDDADKFLDIILPDAKSNKPATGHSLYNLAQNPYLLSALIIAYDESPGRDLPSNPGKLTKVLIDALWKREENKQDNTGVHYFDLELAFSKLAFAIIEEGRPNDINRQFAIEKLGSYNLVLAGQSANILSIDGDYIRFYHEMMQDYFAALQLKREGFTSRYNKPMFTRLYRIPDKWDYALQALAGIVKKSDPVINDLMAIDPFWAQTCAVNGLELSEETYRQLTYQLLGQFDINMNWQDFARDFADYENTRPAREMRALQGLIELGEHALPYLIPLVTDPNQSALLKKPIVHILGESRDEQAVEPLKAVLFSPEDEQRAIQLALEKTQAMASRSENTHRAVDTGMKVLGRHRDVNTQHQRDSRNYATDPNQLRYRAFAAIALGKIGTPTARQYLQQAAEFDPDPVSKKTAQDVLAQMPAQESE